MGVWVRVSSIFLLVVVGIAGIIGGCGKPSGSQEGLDALVLHFASKAPASAEANSGTEDLFAKFRIQPVFIKTAQYKPWEQIKFGLSPDELRRAEDAVAVMMYVSPQVKPRQGISREELAGKIKSEITQVFARLPDLGVKTPLTRVDKQWLYAFGVCHWALKHTQYDVNRQTVPGKDFCRPAQETLNLPVPSGKCGDLTRLARDLARIVGKDVGLEAYYTKGDARTLENPSGFSHAWVFVKVDGGGSFADVMPVEVRSDQISAIARDLVMPRTPESMELFLATHASVTKDRSQGSYNQGKLSLGDVEEQWSTRGNGAEFFAGDLLGHAQAGDIRATQRSSSLTQYLREWRDSPQLEAHRRALIPLRDALVQ